MRFNRTGRCCGPFSDVFIAVFSQLASIGLVDAMVPPQMVFVAGQVFADLLTVLTLHSWGIAVQILHVPRYRVPVDELQAHRTLGFICF